jgi:protein-disulfide isomerase
MRRAVGVTASLVLMCLAAGGAWRALTPVRCPAPSGTDKNRLIGFVRARYKLPPAADVGMADGGVVPGSCFRKLVFASVSGRRFQAELFASPDFRFLTTDLIDAKPEPEAQKEQRRETAASLTRGNPPFRGSGGAPVTVAVFSDFQCPFCAGMAKTIEGLAASEGDKLRVVYHYFPLSIHRWATRAAEAAACAERQSNIAFWDLHDFFFAHQRELSSERFEERLAIWAKAEPDLDQAQFQRCVVNSLTSGPVEQDIALGTELGVRATPSVFVNGEPATGSSPDELRDLVRRAERGK